MGDPTSSASSNFNPYLVLSLPMTARNTEIEHAYNRVFDRYEQAAEAGDEAAVKMLEDANRAFDILSDAEQRRKLDARLAKTGYAPTPGTRATRPAPGGTYGNPAATARGYGATRFGMSPQQGGAIAALKALGWMFIVMTVIVALIFLASASSAPLGGFGVLVIVYVIFIIVAGVGSGTFFLVVANIAENVAAMRSRQEEGE